MLKKFFRGLMYENGSPSLTRSLSVIFAAAFLLGSFYLLVKGQSWDHYPDFAYITGGGGIGGQVANKFLNNKYLSGGSNNANNG